MTKRAPWNTEASRRLRDVQRERKTGRLRATEGPARREMSVRDGRIVGIRTSVEEERLGNVLMRLGRITRQHFEDASIFVRHGWRLGDILVELGILARGEVEPALRHQVVEVGCAILRAPHAAVAFEETTDPFTTLASPLRVPDLIMEAARRIANVDGMLETLVSDKRRFRPVESSFLAECTGLTPEEVYLMSRFQGGASLEAVLRASDLEEGTGAKTLVGLLDSGMLVSDEAPPTSPFQARFEAVKRDIDRMHARLEKQDPWKALDLPPDCGIETAHAAFRDAVRRYHPDRYQSAADPDLYRKLSSICESFTTAYSCLTTALRLKRAQSHESAIPLASTIVPTAPAPPGPEETIPPVSAPEEERPSSPHAYDPEVFVREAKRAMHEGDTFRAIELLRTAIQAREDRAEYHFLLAEALSKNPRWRHDAEKSYLRAIELEPYHGEYYESLAKLYESVGLTHRAQATLRQGGDFGAVGTPSSPETVSV